LCTDLHYTGNVSLQNNKEHIFAKHAKFIPDVSYHNEYNKYPESSPMSNNSPYQEYAFVLNLFYDSKKFIKNSPPEIIVLQQIPGLCTA